MDIKIATTEATSVEAINFENKRKMIFDCLNEASEKLVGTTLEQKASPTKRHRSTFDEPNDTQDRRIRHFNGKESIFKRPVAPISKCLKPRQTPDYQVCIRNAYRDQSQIVLLTSSDLKPLLNVEYCRWIHTNGKSIRWAMPTYLTNRIRLQPLHFWKRSRIESLRRIWSTATMTRTTTK